MPSYSKIHGRPSTPIVQKHRYKLPASSVQRTPNDEHMLHLRSFDQIRLSSSLSSASHTTRPRRLARSAHLHTLSNAGRLQTLSKQEVIWADTGDDGAPAKNVLQLKSGEPEDHETMPSSAQEHSVTASPFDNEEPEGGSASEVEDDVDSVSSAP